MYNDNAPQANLIRPNDIDPATVLKLVAQNKENDDSAIQQLYTGTPFNQIELNLADSDLASTAPGRPIDVGGWGLLYRREGSAPDGRLNVRFQGGPVVELYPGARIRGRFERFEVVESSRSGTVGKARLVVLEDPRVDFLEPAILGGEPFSPVDLVGTSSSGTFQALIANTAPVGAGQAGAFAVNGWSRVRLLIDLGAVPPATVFTLTPWTYDTSSAIWYDQSTEQITVPDSVPTNQRYRIVNVAVSGSGLMYFVPNIALSVIVQGIA